MIKKIKSFILSLFSKPEIKEEKLNRLIKVKKNGSIFCYSIFDREFLFEHKLKSDTIFASTHLLYKGNKSPHFQEKVEKWIEYNYKKCKNVYSDDFRVKGNKNRLDLQEVKTKEYTIFFEIDRSNNTGGIQAMYLGEEEYGYDGWDGYKSYCENIPLYKEEVDYIKKGGAQTLRVATTGSFKHVRLKIESVEPYSDKEYYNPWTGL